MTQRTLIVAIVCLITCTPPLAAAWAFHGDYEPSTAEDINDHMMFTSPYSGNENRVYFNGFVGQDCTGATALNPNVGDPGVRSEIVGPCDIYMAMLGVWADCNKDGYVGLGETGFQEYRVEVLTANPPPGGIPDVCKPVTTPPTSDSQLAAWHNDGNWVREYIPIGWSPAPAANGSVDDYNPYVLKDNASRMWVDQQLAGTDGGHGACLLGLQTYSTQSVGGFLYWADCSTGRTTITTIDLVAEKSNHPELGFADAKEHEYDSNSALNEWNPYGQGNQDSMVTVWDCSKTKTFAPRDPTSQSDGQPGALWRVHDPTADPTFDNTPLSHKIGNKDGWKNITWDDGYILHGANVSGMRAQPSTNLPPPSTNPGKPGSGPSVAGTMNATVSGTDRCARNTDADHGTRADTFANPYAIVESGFPAAAVKTTPHATLAPSTTARRDASANVKVYDPTAPDADHDGNPDKTLVDTPLPEVFGHAMGVTTTGVGGVATVSLPFNVNRFDPQGINTFLGLWVGGGSFVVEGPGVDSNNGKTTGIQYNRYYAYVTPQSFLALPPGGAKIYGGNDEVTGAPPQCGGNIITTPAAIPTFTNVYNGWDCKTGDWYQDLDGKDLTPRSAFLGCDQNNPGPNQNDPNLCKRVRVGPIVGDTYNLKDLDCWDESAKPARDAGVSLGLIGDWGGNPTQPAKCT